MSGQTNGETRGVALEPSDSDAFRVMVEGVRDYAIFMLNPDGVIATWNVGAERIKGYAADEIIGQHFSRFYTEEALVSGWPAEELRRARQHGRFEDEGWRIRKDGTRFWANVIITALRNSGGGLIGYSKITRDLTERRLQEERLRQSEENIRLLVEGVKDHAIFMVDPDGLVLNWNAGAERVLGFRSADVIGRNVSILYIGEDIVAGKPLSDLTLARDAGYVERTCWRLHSDGTRVWSEVTINALREHDGSLRGFATIIRDLSQRRRVQELETEGKRVNEFIAMLAHELRNPLAPISNAVKILEMTDNTPQVAWSTQVIGRQVGHLARLVEDLLDASRITSGKIQMRKEPLELNAVVNAAVESVRSIAEGYGHTLEVQTTTQPLPVHGDETRLTQVVVNLITNAAKYTPKNGHIRVELYPRGSVAALRVIDNGIGMSKTLLNSAFDLFVQGDRTLDRTEGGLGVGLTLVKRIVTMHGGTVGVTSAGPGKGSEFTVTLPLGKTEAKAVSPIDPNARSHRLQRILVVDDNEDAAISLATLLEMSGHDVNIAHDGPSALVVAAANPPDAVLLDLGLPDMDGYQVARRMGAMPELANTRLIAVTGYGHDDDKRAARAAGFTVHLVKPVEFDDVLRAIAPVTTP